MLKGLLPRKFYVKMTASSTVKINELISIILHGKFISNSIFLDVRASLHLDMSVSQYVTFVI